MELLYNNSINMLSCCHTIYHYDKDGTATRETNPWYGQPIPAYRRGYTLFANSHLPEKITVFGVGQRTQDIYNADILRDILAKTVITRTFEEVTGKDIKRIHQELIPFSAEEKAVWVQAVKEFHTMRQKYFTSTNNARKDAMLRIIQQITLLLRISAAPNTVSEYSGELPGKLRKTIQLTQLHDLNIALQKRYTLLQWEQGSGKTLAGIAYGKYRMDRQGYRNTWVISSAISIRNNWNVVLPNYDVSYVFVERLRDLERIKPGDFVLMTFNALCKYRRQIKKWLKIHSRKTCLVLDESDEIAHLEAPSTAIMKVTLPSPPSAITAPPVITKVPQLSTLFTLSFLYAIFTALFPRLASHPITPSVISSTAPGATFTALPALAIPSVVILPPAMVSFPPLATKTTCPDVPV